MRRFALFYAKTLDRIADPTYNDSLLPQELFEIGPLLAKKIPKSKWYNLTGAFSDTFMNVQRFINVLKNVYKYDIAASPSDENQF